MPTATSAPGPSVEDDLDVFPREISFSFEINTFFLTVSARGVAPIHAGLKKGGQETSVSGFKGFDWIITQRPNGIQSKRSGNIRVS